MRSHSGYVYSRNICNENDYKTFWTHFYTIFSIPFNRPYYSNPPIINNYYNVQYSPLPPIIPTPPIIRDSRVIELFVEYTFKGRRNSNFEYSDEKIRKIRLKCKRLVLMKNCCLLFLACCSQNQENLKELAKIRKFHFSCQKVWRNKHATENYF